MSIKINKNGKEYDLGFVPQSLYDDVEDLKANVNKVTSADDEKISNERYRTIFSPLSIVTGSWTVLGTLAGKTTHFATATVNFESSVAITNEGGYRFIYPLFQNAVALFIRIDYSSGEISYYTTNANITGFRVGVEYTK